MRYRPVKALVCALFFVVGIVVTAAGLRDLKVSSGRWLRDFAIEPAIDGAERPPTPATATFSGRPYCGIAWLRTLPAFGSGSFRVTLDEIRFEDAGTPTGTLTISQYGEDTEIALSPGRTFSLDGTTVTALALRLYVGLWPDPTGVPMAGVSVRLRDLWIENLLVQSKQWLRLEDGPAVRFLWCGNEEEARRHVAAGRPGIESARWGVHDGGRTHWFGSFVPGAGVELSDGTIVTLVALDEAAIELDVSGPAGATRRRIQANTDDPLAVLEYPAFNADLLLLYAWEDGGALAAYLPKDGDSAHVQLAAGEEWAPEAGGIAVRLEQVSRAAVPVEAGQSAIFEALLQVGSSRVRVRQGEAVRVGDALLRFNIQEGPLFAHYGMTLASSSGNQIRFALTPDTPFSFSTAYGSFSLKHEDVHPGSGLTLRPEGVMLPVRLQIGALILAVAVMGLLLARRRPH